MEINGVADLETKTALYRAIHDALSPGGVPQAIATIPSRASLGAPGRFSLQGWAGCVTTSSGTVGTTTPPRISRGGCGLCRVISRGRLTGLSGRSGS
jgi:hypothetical protein